MFVQGFDDHLDVRYFKEHDKETSNSGVLCSLATWRIQHLCLSSSL